MSTEEEINPYELLDLKSEATDQEIRTAYRQRSLKVHPDRVSHRVPLLIHRPNLQPFLTVFFLCRTPIIPMLVCLLPLPYSIQPMLTTLLPLARKFHELNQAYELLLDPLRRMALDAKLRVKQARAERFKSYDNKRKNMLNELEERERAFKKRRMDKAKEERDTFWRRKGLRRRGRG